MIYLDNAATSWPKPPCVAQAMVGFLERVGANPGRAGHRQAVAAGRIVYAAREAVAELFGASDPLRIVFGANVTEALNLALRGLLRSGDHVVTTSIEHNSVMRPLRALERQGVALTVVRCSPQGFLDPADLERALQPETALIVLNHASNVVGSLQPVAEVGELAHRHGALLLLDAAQTGGSVTLDMGADRVDLLAFTGHKSLYGPMGTGGLVIGERVAAERIEPIILGGTGSLSEREEQPAFLPDRFESGTPNVVGLAGLEAGVRWVLDRGVASIRREEQMLTQRLLDGLSAIPGVRVYGSRDATRQVAVVAFNIAGLSPAQAGLQLDEEFGILCRVGLHCSPAAHRTIGTFPEGTIRFALGVFTTVEDIEQALAAVEDLARRAR